MTSLNLKRCINIPDDFEGYSKDVFCVPKHYEDSISSILVSQGTIQDRIQCLARDIFQDVIAGDEEPEPLNTLCVLKGGYKFYSDLQDKLNTLNSHHDKSVQISVDFVRLKSYENTSSTGEIQIVGSDNLKDLKGKNVLVVEDIVDTGKTMQKLLKTLWSYEPKRVIVACLLRKRTPLSDGYIPDYVGFEIPDKFVIGYALDYNEYFRDLMHICLINDHGIEKYKA
jgi:hypoxanthine phosphoribosyltransferase